MFTDLFDYAFSK
jgi:hypothetical protein